VESNNGKIGISPIDLGQYAKMVKIKKFDEASKRYFFPVADPIKLFFLLFSDFHC